MDVSVFAEGQVSSTGGAHLVCPPPSTTVHHLPSARQPPSAVSLNSISSKSERIDQSFDRTVPQPRPTSAHLIGRRRPPSAMSTSSTFPAVPSLSNSKFETYKLAPLEQDVQTTLHALPAGLITQSRVHAKTVLSVREVQSRIRHDHLGRGWGQWFGFVDEEWAAWAVKIDEVRPPLARRSIAREQAHRR